MKTPFPCTRCHQPVDPDAETYCLMCPHCQEGPQGSLDADLAVTAFTVVLTGKRVIGIRIPLEADGFHTDVGLHNSKDRATDEILVQHGHCGAYFPLGALIHTDGSSPEPTPLPSPSEAVRAIARRMGWTPQTVRDLLLEYVEQLEDPLGLQASLEAAAEQEAGDLGQAELFPPLAGDPPHAGA